MKNGTMVKEQLKKEGRWVPEKKRDRRQGEQRVWMKMKERMMMTWDG